LVRTSAPQSPVLAAKTFAVCEIVTASIEEKDDTIPHVSFVGGMAAALSLEARFTDHDGQVKTQTLRQLAARDVVKLIPE